MNSTQILECIDIGNVGCISLTIGGKYEVLNERSGMYEVLNDRYRKEYYHSSRFIKVEKSNELLDLKDEIKDIDKPIDWVYKEIKEYLINKKNNMSIGMLNNRYFYILGVVDALRYTKHLSPLQYSEAYRMLHKKEKIK